MARIFVDTNVLFPFSVMDLMLALAEDGMHDVMWTDRLLDEREHVIVREKQRSADVAAAISSAVRETPRPERSADRWTSSCCESTSNPSGLLLEVVNFSSWPMQTMTSRRARDLLPR